MCLNIASLGCAGQVVHGLPAFLLGGSAEQGSFSLELALGFQLAPTSLQLPPTPENDCCFLPSPETLCPRFAVGGNGQPHVPKGSGPGALVWGHGLSFHDRPHFRDLLFADSQENTRALSMPREADSEGRTWFPLPSP